jgi:TrkA domain protein
VIVTHNTGKREVFRREDPDADSEKLFELSDETARQVGTILKGAYFQPVRSELIETVLGGDTVLEWVAVGDDRSRGCPDRFETRHVRAGNACRPASV